MSEQLRILKLVATRLEGADISYMLTGSLVLSKLLWAKDSRSAVQLGDVKNLVTAVEEFDWDYARRWANELSVSDLVDEVRS